MASSFAAQLADALETSWPAMARPNQLPPPGGWWQIWLLLQPPRRAQLSAG